MPDEQHTDRVISELDTQLRQSRQQETLLLEALKRVLSLIEQGEKR